MSINNKRETIIWKKAHLIWIMLTFCAPSLSISFFFLNVKHKVIALITVILISITAILTWNFCLYFLLIILLAISQFKYAISFNGKQKRELLIFLFFKYRLHRRQYQITKLETDLIIDPSAPGLSKNKEDYLYYLVATKNQNYNKCSCNVKIKSKKI